MSDNQTEYGSGGKGSPDDAPFNIVGGGGGNVYEDMQFATQSVTINAQETRRETLRGEEHLVAPVTAVREMVLKGEFLPYEEIKKTLQAWNGKLLTLTHPKVNGLPEPASIPRNYERFGIGSIFNASAQNRGLQAEAWMNVNESAQVADDLGEPDPVQQVENGENIEVSVGYWYDRYEETGTHDGVEYGATQGNIRPDHLATLPSGTGECSIEDGCGITVNEEGLPMVDQGELDEEALEHYKSGVQARSSPRDPQYNGGLETQGDINWGDVDLSLQAFIDAYADGDDKSNWDDLTSQEKSRISARTLNGDPDADSADDAIVLPVVRPASDALHEGGLDAALQRAPNTGGGINTQEVQSKCRSLLERHFDRDFDSEARQLMNRLLSVMPTLGGGGESHKEEECQCQHEEEEEMSEIETQQTEGDAVRWESDAGGNREPNDIRYGVVVDALEDDDDNVVYVAPYQADEDFESWEPVPGDPLRMDVDNLEVVGSDGVASLPPISQVIEAANQENGDTQTMADYDYEKLAKLSAFGEEELRENDDLAKKVSQTLDSNEDEEQSDEEEESNEDNEEAQNDDLAEQVSSIANSVETINDNVQSLSERVEDIEESHQQVQSKIEAQEEDEKRKLKNRIMAHSSLEEDQLPDNKEQLDALADELKPRGGWAGGVSSTANEEAGSDIALGLNEAMQKGD